VDGIRSGVEWRGAERRGEERRGDRRLIVFGKCVCSSGVVSFFLTSHD